MTDAPAPPGAANVADGRSDASIRPLSVLLFSPVGGRDPASGDVAYTEALLGEPPLGVHYTTYAQAIEAGVMEIRGRRPAHGMRRGTIDLALFGVRGVEVALRRARVMYREPTWFVTIRPGVFDLVHQHLFAVRQVGPRLPVVSSAGYPLPELYAAREGWSPARLRLATALEWRFDQLLDVHNPWLRGVQGNVMTVYTERFRQYLIRRGAAPEDVVLSSTALPAAEVPASRSDGRTIGFIGRDFEAKGGDIALDAFKRLRHRRPELRLRIITGAQGAPASLPELGVEVLTDLSNEEVVTRHLPEIDVLVAPSHVDCGVPYAVLEALRAAIPVVISDLPWLDERLRPPAARRVPPRADAVAGMLEALLDEPIRAEASAAAQRLWAEECSMAVLHRRLGNAYRGVAESRTTKPRRVLTTAANSRFFRWVLTLVCTLDARSPDSVDGVQVWDLGLRPHQRALLASMRGVVVRAYPPPTTWPYPDWLVPAHFAWKPFAIAHSGHPGDAVLYLDAGTAIAGPLGPIFEIIERDGVFVTENYGHANRDWTSQACRQAMGCTPDDLDAPQVQAGFLGFRLGPDQALLDDWVTWSAVREAFVGSHVDHRHDQTVLSVLAHRAGTHLFPPGAYDRWQGTLAEAEAAGVPFYVHRGRSMPPQVGCLWTRNRVRTRVGGRSGGRRG